LHGGAIQVLSSKIDHTGRIVGLNCLNILCRVATTSARGVAEKDLRELLSASVSAALDGLLGDFARDDKVTRAYAAVLLSHCVPAPASKLAAINAGVLPILVKVCAALERNSWSVVGCAAGPALLNH
jgi:hypothetical protein